MNKGLYFILGTALGAAISYYLASNKYKAEMEKEIESIRELYKKHEEKNEPEGKESEQQKVHETVTSSIDESALKEFASNARKYSANKAARSFFKEAQDRPYVIPPNEYGEFSDYEQIGLTYYADGVITDESGDPMDDDIDEIIGDEFVAHFGEYPGDAVYIRNDERKTDYEIARDLRKYRQLGGT